MIRQVVSKAMRFAARAALRANARAVDFLVRSGRDVRWDDTRIGRSTGTRVKFWAEQVAPEDDAATVFRRPLDITSVTELTGKHLKPFEDRIIASNTSLTVEPVPVWSVAHGWFPAPTSIPDEPVKPPIKEKWRRR